MSKHARLALPLAALTMLSSGCATPTVLTATNCDVGNHVLVRRADVLTPDTSKDILVNNRSREAGGCKKVAL